MTNIAIRVDNLSKCYHIYDHPQDRLKQSIMPKLRSLVGRNPGSYYREFWALKEVSFEVGRGETVGIIGRNGSGKSTLLQMICGTLEPTIGTVETHGRVAALLELGAGFNPEFTGRENVYMNATVLGLTQDEIRGRFDEIAAFADIGDFIDQPVKHYSSGMYVRLAFAVAINVDPSILIIDEALAVGDEPFQRKCFARIEEIKRNGGTILFVSHSSHAIVGLCDRAVLLYGGERLYTGKPKKAVSWYQKLMNAAHERSAEICVEIRRDENATEQKFLLAEERTFVSPEQTLEQITLPKGEAKDRAPGAKLGQEEGEDYDASLVSSSMVVYEPNGAEISAPCILTTEGRVVNCLVNGARYQLYFDVVFYKNCQGVRFFTAMKTVEGVMLGSGVYPRTNEEGFYYRSGEVVRMCYEFTCALNRGVYFLNCGVQEMNGSLLHRIIDAMVFRVAPKEETYSTGTVDFSFRPKLVSLEPAANNMKER